MDVMLLTMVFPWPSEAFAGVEVRALRAAGATVRVRTLRSVHPLRAQLLDDWRLKDLDLTSWSPGSVLRGCAFLLRHPWIVLRTLAWLVRHGWTRPALTARCLLLLPRMFEIFAECLNRPPDVLCLFWGHYPSVLAYMTRTWLPGVHVSVSLNAYDLVYAFPPSVNVAKRADSVWTIARANLAAISALGIDLARVRVNLHGIDLTQIPEKCRDKDPHRWVCVARLEENKGVDDVIRAVAVVVQEHPEICLTIMGEGPERARLEALVREQGVNRHVHFAGGCTHTAVYEQLRTASILLLLSRSPAERLPNVVKEAMACRCLCVVTRTPGIEELLTPLARPMVVDQGDWQGAAACLASVLADPVSFAADRDAGRRFMLANLDALAIARNRLVVWGGGS
jgi:glycosyltransferase involved in cell wall biosynthesis